MSISPSIVKALLKPQAYPHKPQEVKLVQTQMSFVFLSGDYAYKVKKPVNLGYLDYTTLEKRRFFCYQELKLNRRLCPDVYLAVVPITMSLPSPPVIAVSQSTKPFASCHSREGEAKQSLVIEGDGKPVEYAVKMKQLPQDCMLDVLLSQGKVTEEMIAKVAEKLANFHQTTKTNSEIATFGKLDVIRQNWDENFAQTEKYIDVSFPRAKYDRTENYANDFMRANASLFEKRVEEGKIKDCHGDLHAAHICFTDDICVYDCIEFNDRFRYCDIVSELAFLAMDLDRYQRADLSQHLVNTYVKLTHDEESQKLLNFYKCYRAYVRGKVESFKLDDPLISEDEKAQALENAQSYFQLAESYVI